MYIYSEHSRYRVVHTGDCFHSKRITPEHSKQFDTLEAAIKAGFRLCKHCNPMVGQFRQEQGEILDYCYQQGMTCVWVRAGVRVETPFSRWMIVPSPQAGGSELYHKNTQKRKTPPEDILYPGFHRQRVCYDTLLPYFTYILDHDRYRKENPLPAPKAPAKKGTKRYRKEQKRAKKRTKREAVRNVLRLFDRLEAAG